jgi:hypothetical protein
MTTISTNPSNKSRMHFLVSLQRDRYRDEVQALMIMRDYATNDADRNVLTNRRVHLEGLLLIAENTLNRLEKL